MATEVLLFASRYKQTSRRDSHFHHRPPKEQLNQVTRTSKQKRWSRSAPPLMVVATEAAERHGVKICVDRLDGCSPKLLEAFPSEHVLHIYRLYDVFCTADETGDA